jgi:hypothetical protein
MEKLQYLFWGASDDRQRVSVAFSEELAPALLELDPAGLGIDVIDPGSATASPVPGPEGENPHVAVVSIELSAHDLRGPFESVLARFADTHRLTWAGYLVSAALYTDYGDNEWSPSRDWPDGTRSPGLLTVCLIHRPVDMAHEAWVRQWHDVQSPVSAEIQPRCRYVRNEVVRPVTEGAPLIDGIVEEAWPSINHVADPMLFFCAGDDSELLTTNIEAMMQSVTAFIDMDRMRNECMGEFLFRSTR